MLADYEHEYHDGHLIHAALDYQATRTPDEPAVINAAAITWPLPCPC
jgi:hypothetical protein